MKIYHRNTNSRFILLWAVFALLITAVLFFAIKGMFLGTLLTLGVIIIAGNIRIHGLTISKEKISIRRYYSFGFIKREFIIPYGKFNDLEFWEHGNLDNAASTDTWLDIFYIPALMVAGKRGVIFKTGGPDIKSLRLYINDKEHQMFRELMQRQNKPISNK